ncbi:hypothetical protein NBRC116594_14640 [Shimia sp. NS0008-38b]|uniref:DUF4926 domain-containing protein n=1 Tax=Shimia sp. NS0008-38b TaxID=3127653 RepID=UPI003106643A
MTHHKDRFGTSGRTDFKLYEEVELRISAEGLPAGSIGTVIDIPPRSHGVCVAEFIDENGVTVAILDLKLRDVQ